MADQNPGTATLGSDADTKIAHDVKIEDVGPAKKRLTITVTAETIAEKLRGQMDVLQGQTAIPGFRKGHAPRALMEKRFGSAVKTETRNQIVSEAYQHALDKTSIRPVGEPEPVTKVEEIELKEGKPLTFEVDVEVVPDFKPPSLKGIEIKKPKLDITEEHIENELQRQRQRFGEAHKIEGDFQQGDRLLCHGTATRKGEDEPFFTHNEVIISHPGEEKGQIVGLLIDGLGKALAGKKVGDTFTVETAVPESHEREDIRGKDIVMELQIRHAERVNPADLEEIARNYGMDSVDVFRKQITFALEQKRDEEQKQAMRDQVFERLADSVEMELPQRLSTQQAERIVRQRELELLYQGLPQEEIETHLAEFRAQSEAIARNRLKLFFIMHRLTDEYKIAVSEQEINGRIAQMAAQRGLRPEALRNELANAGRMHEVAMLIRDQKIADRIIGEADVTEVSASEWRKELIAKSGKSGKGAKSKPAEKSAESKSEDKKPAAKTTKKKTTKKT